MEMKKIKIYFFINLLIFIILFIELKAIASTKLDGISNFPDSYKPYLEELQKKHPNWKFTALYTNLDWKYVIDEENVFGKNLVPKNYSDSWKNTTPGQYNVEIDGGFVDSSRQAVEYCMDPRNFLNEVRMFQFEGLSFDNSITNLEGIEKILYGTEFYKNKVSYLDSNGNKISMNETYGDLILKAGKTSKVSPYHLASRIKQEVGPFLTHNSISGTVEGYKGLYNFYNIGATSSTDQMGAIKKGLQYAKDANGAGEETRTKYLIPWNTKEKSITGGAIFIGSSYINVGQNTVYLQKFDVNDDRGLPLFWHQYMTNILAPYSESNAIYQGYSKNGMLDASMYFIIPVYNNMPEIPQDNPNIKTSDFTEDNKEVYCTAKNVNVRTGPSTSYEIITTISSPDKLTRLSKGIQAGERWDKVKLKNGIIGYVYQSYLEEVKESEETEDLDIAFDSSLVVNGLEISGLDHTNNTVKALKDKITTNLELEFVNNKNEILTDASLLGTGSKIIVKKSGNTLKEYKIILYGDANGDGKINSVDLLVIQRDILEIENLESIYKKASNIRKNGKTPSSIDLLLIQRHILGLQLINQ